MAPLSCGEASGDALLVARDAAQRARQKRAPTARQPQAVGAAVGAAAALDQAARLEMVEHADHGGAVALGGLGQAALRHARVGIDVDQHSDAARREPLHARGEVAEYRLLGKPQTVPQEPGQGARIEFLFDTQTN